MLRKTLTSMLAALLVVGGTGTAIAAPLHPAGPGTAPSAGLAAPAPGPAEPGKDLKPGAITLSGRLECVTSLSSPHYEVNGYVLIFQEAVTLDNLAGQHVIVTGTPVTGPSIYMRKSLAVASIVEASTYTPPVAAPGLPPAPATPALPPATAPEVPPAPAPATPAMPPSTAPELPPVNSSEVPAFDPVPLWGSPYYILFGQIEATDTDHVLIHETRSGLVRLSLRSNSVDLASLAGQRVGLIASRDPGIEGSRRYCVIDAVILTGDLGKQLHLGPIYSAPQNPITIMLRDRKLTLDQAPIVGNGRTLVPLRAIGEALGARVDWNPATQTATVALGGREVKVTVGSNRVLIAEPDATQKIIYSDIAPVIAGGRTLVPVRVISEGLGLQVGWNEATHTVTLD
ncbi:MAG TPA: copper amine oxidase N-terminal domain-containing protein [Symbiobacteriaceae bacterium]|nr:copper amine oxidase N-terminal domain-containing protein [Symbiobacteriaceae bacterium]